MAFADAGYQEVLVLVGMMGSWPVAWPPILPCIRTWGAGIYGGGKDPATIVEGVDAVAGLEHGENFSLTADIF